MKQKLNQKGFAAIEALLIVVIVAIVGGTGYYIYQANNKATDTQNTAQTNANTAAPGKKANGGKGGDGPQTGPAKTEVFLIKEWNVSSAIPAPPESAALIQYQLTSSTQPVSAGFTTQELIDADSACSVDRAPAGIVSRAQGDDKFYLADGSASGKTVKQELSAGNYKPYKQIGNYYYWYTPAQAACGSTSHVNDLQKAAATEVKQIVTHLAQGT